MATLFSRLYETFLHVVPTATSDGESGTTTTWTDGSSFLAVASFDTSVETRTGAEAGVSSRYTVTTPTDTALSYHDIIKRQSDGKYFRVTSDGDDVVTPPMASFQFLQVTAEEWTLPDGGETVEPAQSEPAQGDGQEEAGT